MTYPPADDRLRHLVAQEINPHVDSWKLAFFLADGIVTSRVILAELDRIATAHAAGQPCGDRQCRRCFETAAGIRDAVRTAARQTTPVGPCGCGAPATPNVIHRQGAPCYMDQDGGLQTVELPPATARQTTGQDDTKPDPTTADDPTPLRWGLGDVLHGDDDTTLVCFSGPDREPYALHLEPEQRDALRDDLTPPETHVVTDDSDDPEHTDDCPGCEDPAVGQPAEAHDTDRAVARAEQAEAELAALKTVTTGYCPRCGRGDCSPTADQWLEQRQRAEQAEAAIARVRAWAAQTQHGAAAAEVLAALDGTT